MMLTWRDAGYHAAHGMEGAGATGEDTVHKCYLPVYIYISGATQFGKL